MAPKGTKQCRCLQFGLRAFTERTGAQRFARHPMCPRCRKWRAGRISESEGDAVSGLETAIRNALSRSERGDATIRARIYQTARQALEAGLTRQAVTDPHVIAAERQRLEMKIREIEGEERERESAVSSSTPQMSAPPPRSPASMSPAPQSPAPRSPAAPSAVPRTSAPPVSAVSPNAPSASRPMRVDPVMAPSAAPEERAARDSRVDVGISEPRLDDATRAPAGRAPEQPLSSEASLADLGAMRAERRDDRLAPPPQPERKGRKAKVKPARGRKADRQAQSGPSGEDLAPGIPGEKRKRRRRGILSRLFIWLIMLTFIVMGGWWAWTSGLFLTDAQRDTSVPNPPATVSEEDFSGTPSGTSSGSPPGFDPQQGFSADWLEVFGPDRKAAVSAGASATVETVAMADGPALRITSATPDQSGDVAVEVPADILRELSGKTSTIALTLQSAVDSSVQVAVRCDFASLGNCSRHRVAASQERADTLFRVTFDRTLAPNQPGRIYINSDILGGRSPIFLYSVRVLPGQ
jgi:cytoskeletal protein RodZ